LISVLGKHDPEAHTAAAAVAKQLDAMVLANAADASHPGVHGLSLFCPKEHRTSI